MTTDARTLAERLFAVIDGQRWDEYETVMHPDARMSSPFSALQSAAEWVEFSRGFAAAMPDGRHSVTNVVQDGDRFAIEGTWTGTHTGPLATPQGEVPPTGRTVTMPFCAVATQRDDRLAQVTVYLDQLGMLAQLGLVPEPASAA
ncbi:ester cyclase [Geodermatophilus sp. URMC 64]